MPRRVRAGALPLLAWHGLDRATRAAHLTDWTGLAADATSAALLAGRPGHGIELADCGRSVLWTQLLQLRSELHDIAEAAPHLAARMSEIRDKLDTVGSTTQSLL